MKLGKQQEHFMRLLPRLIDHVHGLGYEIRGGDLFRDPRLHGEVGEKYGSSGLFVAYGHKNSCHKMKLAIDLNLTYEGVYLTGSNAQSAHNQVHDFWDELGGSNRIAHDLNHYSLERNGNR
jgi:hypothetical protein